MGFIEETGAAQHLRDARIAPIYEGTNGIQADDLVGRKLMRDNGAAARALIAEMRGAETRARRGGTATISRRSARARRRRSTRWTRRRRGSSSIGTRTRRAPSPARCPISSCSAPSPAAGSWPGSCRGRTPARDGTAIPPSTRRSSRRRGSMPSTSCRPPSRSCRRYAAARR